MRDLNISIVLYNTEKDVLKRAIKSVLKSCLNLKLFLIDNSKDKRLEEFKKYDPRIVYIHTGKNIGHGQAHNIAMRKSIEEGVKYHLVMNPDVYFEGDVFGELYNFMEENPDVGLVMPKVLFPDGSLQYLCKLLPSPVDLFGRRFLGWGPFKEFVERKNYIYELRFSKYDKIMNVSYLSGCFMFIRTKILKKVGMFDKRFFLYCDDLDLSRRINRVSRTVFYPYCYIYHEYGKGSYKNLKLLFYHIKDAIKYFNKWGWIKDIERNKINRIVLEELKK